VLRHGCCTAVCVISPDRAPMWGVLADVLSRFVPEQRDFLHLHSHSLMRAVLSRCLRVRASVRFGWNECNAKIRWQLRRILGSDRNRNGVSAASLRRSARDRSPRSAGGGKVTVVTVLI
jgi:hypothetical protein